MGKEWKTLLCDVDNLEENLNWLVKKGFEVYEVYQATEAGHTEADGSNFLVVAQRDKKAATLVPVRSTNVPTKSGSSSKGKAPAKTVENRQKSKVLKGKTCK